MTQKLKTLKLKLLITVLALQCNVPLTTFEAGFLKNTFSVISKSCCLSIFHWYLCMEWECTQTIIVMKDLLNNLSDNVQNPMDFELMLWDIWYLLRYLMKLAWKWAQVRARRRKLSWIVSTLFIFITFQHRPHHLCRQYQSGPSAIQSPNRFSALKAELSFQSEELNLRRNPLRTW